MAKNKKFKTGNPQQQLDEIKFDKYKIGAKGIDFHKIREMKPIFAFDYLSFNSTNLCYDNDALKVEDYLGLLKALKTNSEKTYGELIKTPIYRFHKIDFDKDKISITRKHFKKALSHKPDEILDDDLPTLYQFDLHYHQKARACGFLYKGIFYLVWFDREHSIYPRNK